MVDKECNPGSAPVQDCQPSADCPPSSVSSGLPAYAIALIVLGGVLLVALLAGLAFFATQGGSAAMPGSDGGYIQM